MRQIVTAAKLANATHTAGSIAATQARRCERGSIARVLRAQGGTGTRDAPTRVRSSIAGRAKTSSEDFEVARPTTTRPRPRRSSVTTQPLPRARARARARASCRGDEALRKAEIDAASGQATSGLDDRPQQRRGSVELRTVRRRGSAAEPGPQERIDAVGLPAPQIADDICIAIAHAMTNLPAVQRLPSFRKEPGTETTSCAGDEPNVHAMQKL